MPTTQIAYDFTLGAPSGTSMEFTQSGVTVTVSSALYYGNSNDLEHIPFEFSTPTLSTNSLGIGALNTYSDLDEGFDAHGMYEMVTFAFAQNVTITSITLIPVGTSYNPTGADTQFIVFDQGLVIDQASKQFIDPTDFTNNFSLYGSLLGFGAVNHLDNFRVAGITIEVETDPVPALASNADAYQIKTSDAPATLNVLANDSNAQTITAINTTSLLGAVTLSADGLNLSYSVGSAFDYLAKGATATETFTYTVLGTDGTSQTQTVTVTITGNPNEITGTSRTNALTGTAGRDIILGLAGNDTIYGMDGNDDINGGLDRDRLFGGEGNDRVDGGSGDDYAYGDAGNDTIIGGGGNDRLYGGEGNDSLDGGTGSDRLYGDAGDDVLKGGDSANVLDGGAGADSMAGGAGNDTYYVDDIADKVSELAAGGSDIVYASVDFTLDQNVENLTLQNGVAIIGTGNGLNNRVTGNGANNVLSGLGGNDRLTGGLGNDKLAGGIGRDILSGGTGADEFYFSEFGSANYDSILDFNAAEDSIHLSGEIFGLDIGALDASDFALGSAATTADQRLVYHQATGNLYFDADGNGSGARQLITTLVDGTALTFDDIFVV